MRKAQRLDFAIAWTALCLTPALACAAPAPVHHVALPADPLGSPMWAYHAARLLSDAPVVFDPRVRLILPTIAENQHQFPVTVDARSIPGVQRILVYADLNPLTLAVDYRPLHAEPFLSLRIKLDQRTPVRAAVLAADGKWHVGSAWVDAAGGGCSAPPVGRVKGDWAQHLGEIRGAAWRDGTATRLRFTVRHPMDTGLVENIAAYNLETMHVRGADGVDLARMEIHGSVSEDPAFTLLLHPIKDGPLAIALRDSDGREFTATIGPQSRPTQPHD